MITDVHGNHFHHTAIVEPSVKLGTNNYFGPHCYITGKVEIGHDNRFEGFCSIGTKAEHKSRITLGGVLIGNHNIINEFTTINSALEGWTILGSDCYIMRGVHIGHDAVIENDVTLSCNVIIGGHSHIMAHANMGLGSVIHQMRVVGPYAMIGMNSTITKSIPPFMTALGSPCKERHLNLKGLERNGFSEEEIQALKSYMVTDKNERLWEIYRAFDQCVKNTEPHG